MRKITIKEVQEMQLSLIKKLRRGYVTVVFGCVGYSDKEKRSMMGKIASNFANKIIVTTDNIGNANFEEIYSDCVRDIGNYCIVESIPDRENAIRSVFEKMQANETLVILGKGAEDKQVIGGKSVPYSDVEVVRKLIGEGENSGS